MFYLKHSQCTSALEQHEKLKPSVRVRRCLGRRKRGALIRVRCVGRRKRGALIRARCVGRRKRGALIRARCGEEEERGIN